MPSVEWMGTREPRQLSYLAEWYRPDLSEEQLDHIAATLEECAASLSTQRSTVRLLMAVAVPTDEVIFGVFTATSAHIVAQTCRRAGIPAQRLTAAIDARISAPIDRETPDSSPAGTP
jgi:hypothetical protein